MISRRKFLLQLGIGSVGLAVGMNLKISNTSNFYIYGFIPSNSVDEFLKLIQNKVSLDAQDLQIKKIKLTSKINSNIISGDENKTIYSLNHIDPQLDNFRKSIFNKDADCFISAEYQKTDLLNIFSDKKNSVIIQNQNGIYDELDMNKNYNSVVVSGTIGRTELQLKNKIVKIISAPCRHKHCMKMYNPNGIIACVPNKILIKNS